MTLTWISLKCFTVSEYIYSTEKRRKKKKIMFAALQVKCGANVPETKEEIRSLLLLFTAADWKVLLQCMFVGVMAGFHLRVTCQIVGFLFRSFYLSRW